MVMGGGGGGGGQPAVILKTYPVSLQLEALCLLCRSFFKSLLPAKYNGKYIILFKQLSVNVSSRPLQDNRPKTKFLIL